MCFFFSCLDARKEAKENQGVRDAGQFGGVPKEGWGPAQLGPFGYSRCTRPNFPVLGRGPFLVLMQEKRQKKIKASGTPANLAGYPMGAGHFGALQLFSMYPAKLPRPRQSTFSCLDARKEAKENQGVRDAGQFDRVPKGRDGGRPNWGPSAILDVPGKTSPPSAEGLFLS